MLIQPKRWVAPTAGALLVLVVLAMVWGRQNPESVSRFSTKLPPWTYSGYVPVANTQLLGGLAPPLVDSSSSSSSSAVTDSPSLEKPAYVEHKNANPDLGVGLDPIIPPTTTSTSDTPPFERPAETTTTRAPLAPDVGKNLGAIVLDTTSTSELPTVTTPASGGIDKGEKKPLGPIIRPAQYTPSPNQILISDRTPAGTHNIIKSRSTKDGKYFIVDLWGIRTYNPNLIPHPTLNDTWMVTAQRWKGPEENQVWFTQMICNAVWHNGTLTCTESPLILPVQASLSEQCVGELIYFNLNVGPHDARAFFGPKIPYLVYGTQSKYTCFGQYIQDFRVLTDWGMVGNDGFYFPTDIQRPPPYGPVEKNWFLFWDKYDQAYVHYDVKPHRTFAKLAEDGSVGPNIGLENREKDDACLARHTANVEESVRRSLHQATNSLMVTMCKRSDPACRPTDDNTFVLSIFQQKSFELFHGIYEPYVMLFRRTAPFETYAFGAKPIWTMGRNMAGEKSFYRHIPDDQSEMVYLTSLNWKERGLKYHGYLDDVIFVGFGVEDSVPAVIDVTAEDLIGDIMKC